MRTTLAVVLLLPALLVGGCSDDPPKPKMGASESSTPTASSSASAGAASPQAAVRAWTHARNKALGNGDTARVSALSDRTCTTCIGLIRPIERVYAHGGSFHTRGWSITKSKVRTHSRDRATVDAGLVMSGGRTVSSAGAKPVRYAPEKHIVVFKLRHDDTGWLLTFIGFVS